MSQRCQALFKKVFSPGFWWSIYQLSLEETGNQLLLVPVLWVFEGVDCGWWFFWCLICFTTNPLRPSASILFSPFSLQHDVFNLSSQNLSMSWMWRRRIGQSENSWALGCSEHHQHIRSNHSLADGPPSVFLVRWQMNKGDCELSCKSDSIGTIPLFMGRQFNGQ